MQGLHVVVDSTANIPAELLASYANLHVVPLTVSLGSSEWLENQVLCSELFALVAANGRYPRTSQPSPGDFATVIAPLAEAGRQVIVITLSGGLSGTLQSAKTAAQLVGERQVRVIDSGTTAIGMVRMAEVALLEADRGASLESIAALLINMRQATRTMFVPDTLEYLHRGGRIGGAAALFGTILQIRPVLHLAEGKVAVLDKVRTRQKAVARMLEELKKCPQPAYIGIVHIEAIAEATALKDIVEEMYPGVEVTISACGAVLGTHLGPGLLGVVYQEAVS